jgi:Abortive infection alpha
MGEDVAPYSGAIEETAKTAGKALDLVRDGAGPIADFYGLIIGDQIHAARHRRLDAITRKTRQILKARHLSETAEVAEQIAIPLLEAAKFEPRDEMQDLWAQLLANAMDPSRRDDVRPEFIRTLKELHPTDALVLQWLGDNRDKGWLSADAITTSLSIRRSSLVVTMRNLEKESCAQSNVNQTYRLSDFGMELLMAVRL